MRWPWKRKPKWNIIHIEDGFIDSDRMKEIIQELVDNPDWPDPDGIGFHVTEADCLTVDLGSIPRGAAIQSVTINLPPSMNGET